MTVAGGSRNLRQIIFSIILDCRVPVILVGASLRIVDLEVPGSTPGGGTNVRCGFHASFEYSRPQRGKIDNGLR
jgi:hypothetical protein